MSSRFYDHCDRSECMFNKLDTRIKIRRCDCLVNTDFGGEFGGEHCNFYKPKPKKANKRKSR